MPEKKPSKRASSTKATAGHSSHAATAASRARASSVQPTGNSRSAIRQNAQANSAQQARQSCSSSQQAKSSTAVQQTKHSSSSQQAKPLTATHQTKHSAAQNPKPSSSAQKIKMSSSTPQAKPSASAQHTKPSSSTPKAKAPSSTPQAKPSSSTHKTKTSTTAHQAKALSSIQKTKVPSSAEQSSSPSRSTLMRSRVTFSMLPPREDEPSSSTRLPSHRSIRPEPLRSILTRPTNSNREEVAHTLLPSRSEGSTRSKGNKNGWAVVYKEKTKKWYRIQYSKLAEDVQTDLFSLASTETVKIKVKSTDSGSDYGTFKVLKLPGHIKRAGQRGEPYSWIFVDREKAGKDNYKKDDEIV